MLTLRQLIDTVKQLDEKLLDAPVCAVSVLQRLPDEQAYRICGNDLTGVALTEVGLFLFVDKQSGREIKMHGCPALDQQQETGPEPGEEWKDG